MRLIFGWFILSIACAGACGGDSTVEPGSTSGQGSGDGGDGGDGFTDNAGGGGASAVGATVSASASVGQGGGTTTASSTSGAGGGGNADLCIPDPDGNACIECAKVNCCDEIQTCASDTTCNCVILCAQQGGDFVGCATSCGAFTNGPGIALYNCATTACPVDCPGI